MSQHDQAPIARGPNGRPNLLHVALLSFKDGVRNSAEDNYAVIKFPESYEDAASSVIRTLGHHLQNEGAFGFYVLCPMLNNQDEWIWGKADADDWNFVVEEALRTGKALGFRERTAMQSKTVPWKAGFVQGPVLLTYGTTAYALTTWTKTSFEGSSIDRPLSYMDAIAAVKAAAQHPKSPLKQSLNGIKLNDFKFKFHYFVSTTVSSGKPTTDFNVEFPASAYTDDKIWLGCVPKAHQILGFTLH